MNVKNLNDIKITAHFKGERVEIIKYDLVNKTVNIKKKVFNKDVILTYSSKDDYAKDLLIDNFSDIEITLREGL